jgi:chromosome segregation protein
MYLKRLDLQGFKSFHARTVFEFGPGMTAVVGPNGSGKSNVAESIRWVLGEPASRSLRARRLEDIIFSGSSQKSAVGMAEVSITLDNTESWLPVDYSEVVVTRRAYRNGESEYLINKNRVRLRDVLDLFMKAQVGQNSYAFMGQGLVEEVLLMRPEERRRLLEEAADVRLLRTRLDEARDRLSATRENLERVDLLLDEIGPRLQQLERQAARAADHERLARELSKALQALFGQLLLDAQEAITAARAAFDQRHQELTVAQGESKACEEGLLALSSAVEEREKEISSRRTRLREVSDRVHTLEQRLGFDRERIEAQSARRKEIEDELQTLKGDRADHQRAIEAGRQRDLALRPEIEEAKGLIETRRQELNALEQEHLGLRRRVSEAEDRIERSKRLAAEADAALARLGEDEARVQNEAIRRASQKRELIAQLSAYARDFEATRQRLRTAERELRDAEHERAGLLTMVDSSRTGVLSLETQLVELNGRLAQVKSRHEMLRRMQSSQEGVEGGIRLLLGEDETGQLTRHAAEGLLGLVRDIVRVPPGLEQAIEAALAENVNALVFENLPTALAAIEVLEQREAGRVLTYPLDTLRPTPPVNLMREKGVVGVAARLVRCENRFRSLIDTLLGRVIVVESFPLAQQVLRRGMGSVVTLQGILLRPGGSVTGGVSRAAREVFQRQRELDEIPEDIQALESRAAEVEQRLARERETFSGSSAALAQAEPRCQGLRDEVARLQASLMEARGRLILLRGEARSLWTEVRRNDGTQTNWRQRRDQVRTERDQHEATAAQALESLERDRQALGVLVGRRSGAVDALSEAAAAHADLEGEAKSLRRQAEMLQTNLARTEAQIKTREESLKTIEGEVQRLVAGIETQTAELGQARDDLAALTAEMEPAEGELSHLVGREKSMREQLATARSRLLAAERAHLEAEANLKLRTEELAALRSQVAAEGIDLESGESNVQSGFFQQGELPPMRGGAHADAAELRERIADLRRQIRSMGPVNEQAAADYDESRERYDFLKGQVDDLQGSEKTLLSAIEELEGNIRERLKATFAVVDKEFQRYFEMFFDGGKARLTLTLPEDVTNTGLDIMAQPPGKRLNTLAMLSGGERALTALALLLALLEAHPSPICVLDEVDAALDETNVGRFVDAIRALAKKTQFIIVTHNPRTVEAADVIYGISMGPDSTSKVLSLRLSDATPD